MAWLRDVPASRMVPLLTRFALADWSDLDVDLVVADVLATRGHRVPRTFRTSPAAYLANVLRGVDPADRPTAAEAWARFSAAARVAGGLVLDVGEPAEPEAGAAGHRARPARCLVDGPAVTAGSAADAVAQLEAAAPAGGHSSSASELDRIADIRPFWTLAMAATCFWVMPESIASTISLSRTSSESR